MAKRELKVEPDLDWVAEEERRGRRFKGGRFYQGGKFDCPNCGHPNPSPLEGRPIQSEKAISETKPCAQCGEKITYMGKRGLSMIARDQAVGVAALESSLELKKR
jgi:hypothetical protein